MNTKFIAIIVCLLMVSIVPMMAQTDKPTYFAKYAVKDTYGQTYLPQTISFSEDNLTFTDGDNQTHTLDLTVVHGESKNVDLKEANVLCIGDEDLINEDVEKAAKSGYLTLNFRNNSNTEIYNVYNVFNVLKNNKTLLANSIREVDFRNIKLSDAGNIQGLFDGWSKVKKIDFSGCNFNDISGLDALFQNASNLETIDFTNCTFNNNVFENSKYVFRGCTALKEVIVTNCQEYYIGYLTSAISAYLKNYTIKIENSYLNKKIVILKN